MKTRQTMAPQQCGVFLLFVIALTLLSSLHAQQPSDRPRRAAPPKFEAGQGDTDTFFADALKELNGVRPEHFGKPAANRNVAEAESAGPDAIVSAGWSRLISPDTIEDTVKSTKFALDESITQPAAFAGGGNRKARSSFVTLTTMFAIIAEYDGDVRWKKDAVAARERCRNAAQVCKVGSLQAYNAAKSAKDEIADLIGGNSLGAAEPTPNQWDQLADRSSLMQHLERLFEDQIRPAVSNDARFKSQADELLAASELSSAIAEILIKEDMEDAGDDDYVEYCKQIQTAAKDIVDATRQTNGDAARSAVGVISKACSECHEVYRGG